MTETRKEPDWEGFGRELMEHWPTREVDGSDLFEAAARNGLLVEIPGGYDPKNHIDAEGICPEPGDPWYEYAFSRDRKDLATPTVQEAEALAMNLAYQMRHPFDASESAQDFWDHTSDYERKAWVRNTDAALRALSDTKDGE